MNITHISGNNSISAVYGNARDLGHRGLGIMKAGVVAEQGRRKCDYVTAGGRLLHTEMYMK